MIMRISDEDGGNNVFGAGIEPPQNRDELYRTEITNWRFVSVTPAEQIVRADGAHAVVPVPQIQRGASRRAAPVEQFNESLYFG